MIPTARQLFCSHIERTDTDHIPRRRDEMERKFLSSIVLSNGVSKETYAGRLDDVNKAVLRKFSQDGVAPSTFLDVGVSSGITTWEWFEALKNAGYSPSMTGTDVTMTAYIVSLFKGVHVLVDKQGFPLQYDVLGLALRPWCRRRFYICGYFVITAFNRFIYEQ